MASTSPLPVQPPARFLIKKHLLTSPIIPLLFLLLFLLSLLHPLISRSPSLLPRLPFLFSDLLALADPPKCISQSLLHLHHHHYLTSLLSPCPIFILTNLIIITLLFKTSHFSSSTASSSSASTSNFSDFPSEKFDYGGAASLPEYAMRSPEDFFLYGPPHPHYIFASDPLEDGNVLSVQAAEASHTVEKLHIERARARDDMVGLHKGSNVGNAALAQTKDTKRQDKAVVSENEKHSQSIPTAYKPPNAEHGRAAEEHGSFQSGKQVDRKTLKSSKGGANNNLQTVSIKLESASSTNQRPSRIATPSSHPPPSTDQQQPTNIEVAHQSSNATSTSMPMQPLSSTLRATKSLQRSGAFPIIDDRSNGAHSKPSITNRMDQQAAAKPPGRRSTIHPRNNMVRSYSDQTLSQKMVKHPSGSVANANSSSSSPANRFHIQKVTSKSSSIDDTINHSTTAASIPNTIHMQRTQSLESNCGIPGEENIMAPYLPDIKRSPSLSEVLDALNDDDANKCFSNFIANRFALMKREFDVYST